MDEIRFIGYPEAVIYRDNPDVKGEKTAIKRTLWGDYVILMGGSSQNYQEVRCRSARGWIEKDRLQKERILEVNFVDVGQGDGCFIVLPDKDPAKDKFVIVDAGEGNNMDHFLQWRFNFKGNDYHLPLEFIVISHPDSDHYMGFKDIVTNSRYSIKKIYHNGVVPRAGNSPLGKQVKINDKTYLSDVVDSHQKLASLIDDPANLVDNEYLAMMKIAMENTGNSNLVEMLEYGKDIPGYSTGDLTIKVLGPVTIPDGNNNKLLPSFGGEGPTKNGNSVVLMLKYKEIRILLSGDLNKKSQKFLAEFHLEKEGVNRTEFRKGFEEEHVMKLRSIFEGDVTKSNHHGSNDYLYEFLRGVNPLATVISSGDNETFTHPRPDTLGVIGKTSRSNNPLIFSTELARSAKENKFKDKVKDEILKLQAKLADSNDAEERKKLNEKLTKKIAEFQRNIAVYGMITLRSDGKKIIIAQKKERKSSGFQIYKISPDDSGKLVYEP